MGCGVSSKDILVEMAGALPVGTAEAGAGSEESSQRCGCKGHGGAAASLHAEMTVAFVVA